MYSGSVQGLSEVPSKVKEIFKTVWEISQKAVIDQAADRSPFVCQSQSMSLYLQSPSMNQLVRQSFRSSSTAYFG